MIETKTCTGCGQCKPVEQYRWRTDKKTPQRYTRCDECRNAYWRKRDKRKKPMRKHRRNPRVWPAVDRTENNAFNLWHGPVSREQPLRWQA